MGQQWLGWELPLELVVELLPAWSAVDGAGQAAFKCCGVLRQWLPPQYFFFSFLSDNSGFSLLKDYIKS